MNYEIKEYKQLKRVVFKDDVEFVFEIDDYKKTILPQLSSNQMTIRIGDNFYSRIEFIRTEDINVDELEGYILSQPAAMRKQIAVKRKWLRDNMNKEMTLEYCQNFVKYTLDKQSEQSVNKS